MRRRADHSVHPANAAEFEHHFQKSDFYYGIYGVEKRHFSIQRWLFGNTLAL